MKFNENADHLDQSLHTTTSNNLRRALTHISQKCRYRHTGFCMCAVAMGLMSIVTLDDKLGCSTDLDSSTNIFKVDALQLRNGDSFREEKSFSIKCTNRAHDMAEP